MCFFLSMPNFHSHRAGVTITDISGKTFCDLYICEIIDSKQEIDLRYRVKGSAFEVVFKHQKLVTFTG